MKLRAGKQNIVGNISQFRHTQGRRHGHCIKWDRGELISPNDAITYINDLAHRKGKIKETLTPVKIVIEGDEVAAELITEMEALDDVPDFHVGSSLKKGDKVKWTLSAFYTIKNGKIAAVQLYAVVDAGLRKWMA